VPSDDIFPLRQQINIIVKTPSFRKICPNFTSQANKAMQPKWPDGVDIFLK
jgi:hypothetical protein